MRSFHCKSLNLYYFLRSKGLQEINSLQNPNDSRKTIWTFEKTDELDKALRGFKKYNKPIFEKS